MAAVRLGYDRALPADHHAAVRIEVALVRPETSFFARLNEAFRTVQAGSAASRSPVRLYRSFLEENTPEAIARHIEAMTEQRDALIVVAQDHPRIRQALRLADERGKPVVLLVSDVEYGGKAIYVGIDNGSAGRTAGFLMRRALGGREGVVLTVSHSGAYITHRQRVIGFSQYFADGDDSVRFGQCLVTRDTEELAYASVGAALDATPNLIGIYQAGGSNAGTAAAIEEHLRHRDIVFIGHELSATTRRCLEQDRMLLVIDQQPDLQVHRAIETVKILTGLTAGTPDRSPIPFRIITPENLG